MTTRPRRRQKPMDASNSGQAANRAFPRLLFLLPLLWSVFTLLPSLGGPSWLWGLVAGQAEAAVWLPAWLAVTLLALAGLAGKNGWFERELPGLSSIVKRLGAPGRIWLWLSLAAASVGWGLREQNYFMGDGLALIENVCKPFYLHPNEPLDFFTHQLFHRLLGLIGLQDGALAYALLAVLLLPVFLWLALRMAVLLCPVSRERTAVFMILAFSGTLQLFLGYVESYTLVNLFVCLFLYLGIKLLSEGGGGHPWALSAAAVLAALSHLSAVMLLPAMLFVWLYSHRTAERRASSAMSRDFIIILALFVLGALVGLLLFNPRGLTPLWPSRLSDQAPFTLYDPRYLGFKFNLLLMIAPATFLLTASVLGGWRRLERSERPVFYFLLLSAVGTLFFFFSANAMLGIRDWDLLCLPALPFTAFSAWVFLHLRRAAPGRPLWLGVLALTAAAQILAFARINADQDHGAAFLDRMLPHEAYTGTNLLQLGFLLEESGYRAEALDQYRGISQPELAGNRTINMGVVLIELGKPDSTITVTRNLMERIIVNPKGQNILYSNLSIAYDMTGQPDSGLVYFMRSLEKSWTPKSAYLGLWINSVRKRVVDEGLLRQGLDNLSDFDSLMLLARLYALSKDPANLHLVFNRIVQCRFDCEQWRHLMVFARLVVNREYADYIQKRAALDCPELAPQ